MEQHTPEAEATIMAELNSCVLGHRERLELRVDSAGRALHSLARVRAWLQENVRMEHAR